MPPWGDSEEGGMLRCTAETMPAVTVSSRPSGLPITTVREPTSGEAVAYFGAGRPVRFTLSTATSVTSSTPATFASA